jgi:hypothetical protein
MGASDLTFDRRDSGCDFRFQFRSLAPIKKAGLPPPAATLEAEAQFPHLLPFSGDRFQRRRTRLPARKSQKTLLFPLLGHC